MCKGIQTEVIIDTKPPSKQVIFFGEFFSRVSLLDMPVFLLGKMNG